MAKNKNTIDFTLSRRHLDPHTRPSFNASGNSKWASQVRAAYKVLGADDPFSFLVERAARWDKLAAVSDDYGERVRAAMFGAAEPSDAELKRLINEGRNRQPLPAPPTNGDALDALESELADKVHDPILQGVMERLERGRALCDGWPREFPLDPAVLAAGGHDLPAVNRLMSELYVLMRPLLRHATGHQTLLPRIVFVLLDIADTGSEVVNQHGVAANPDPRRDAIKGLVRLFSRGKSETDMLASDRFLVGCLSGEFEAAGCGDWSPTFHPLDITERAQRVNAALTQLTPDNPMHANALMQRHDRRVNAGAPRVAMDEEGQYRFPGWDM